MSAGRAGWLPALTIAVTILGLVGAVLALRQAEPPPGAQSIGQGQVISTGDTLDDTGIGRVRIGVPGAELVSPDQSEGRVLSQDRRHDCTLYAIEAPPGSGDVWAWVRDGFVVSVGVRSRAGTALGRILGRPLGPGDETLAAWSWHASPVGAIARHRGDGSAGDQTLADTDGDGLLDYAAIDSSRGRQCEAQRPTTRPSVPTMPTLDMPPLEDGALQGVALGMAPRDVLALPGWSERDIGAAGTCRLFVLGESARAYAVDNAVIGLSAPAVVDGPVVGQTVAEAAAAMGPAQVTVDLPSADHVSEVALRDSTGRAFIVTAFPELVAWPHLDVPVAGSDDPMDSVVHAIVLGSTCGGG